MGSVQRASHWDSAYETRSPTGVSWFQPEASVSLRLIGSLGVAMDAPIIDIGGGASTLVDGLLDHGFSDVTVLDLSEAGIDAARVRLGSRRDAARWLREDVLSWRPSRRYTVWHDRAAFHFLVDAADRDRYRTTLRSALAEDGVAVIATFAPDGPDRCSGLPVARYGPEELVAELGGLEIVTTERETHTTPSGIVQPFTWVVAR
jgi:hypothetical protein